MKNALDGVSCKTIVIFRKPDQADYILRLGANHCVCVGNGRNDALMLKDAELGIAVIQTEGTAAQALLAADAVTHNILDALDLLRRPLRR